MEALTKKLVTAVHPEADSRALDKFLGVNRRCGTWQLKLETMEDEYLVGHLKQVLFRFFNRDLAGLEPVFDSFDQILDHGSLGPGASIGSPANDFYTKLFASNLSTTSMGLYRAYTNYIGKFPCWAEAEKNRKGLLGEPVVVRGNRLTFVPKNDEISRVICIEPVVNMFYQQGIKHILEKRLRSFFGIDLKSEQSQQFKNRELARIGSAYSGDRRMKDLNQDLCTIDLSSASDSLAIGMLKEILPHSFMQWIESTRSPICKLPNGTELELNMISTMGNAFTFPLQTIIFASVVMASFEVAGLENQVRRPYGPAIGNFGVFGDDIICPYVIVRKVLRLLDILGFQINHEKTFVEGLFRESCGADFYRGEDVRPVFCKNLDTLQDLFSLINRLNLWSFKMGIPLRRTQAYLQERIPKKLFFLVPPWEADDCGMWVPNHLYLSRVSRRQGSFLYKRFVPKRCEIRVDTEREVIHVPRGGKPIGFNPEGLYLAFLRGNITNGKILSRPREVRYVTKVGVAPNWEIHPTAENPFKSSLGGPGLESLASCSFMNS